MANEELENAFRVLAEAYLASGTREELDELDRRVSEALDSITAEGEAGIAYLLDRLYEDMSLVGGALVTGSWGDDAWNNWLKKREVVKGLARARAEAALPRLEPLVDAQSTDAQFHEIFLPAVKEAVLEIQKG
ncbi:MAG: hypothetical protein ACREJP_10950 [Candidatus Methylomirabilales bacterium]